MGQDAVIVGAGVAGLSSARVLARCGLTPLVLEKSGGVGGRCATRRVHGQPVDHGLAFLQGTDEQFLAEVRAATDQRQTLEWPERVRGAGTPCQPAPPLSGGWRVAYESGLTAYPKSLARDLDVRLRTRLAALRPTREGFELWSEEGSRWTARTVVLAMPVEQTLAVLSGLAKETADAPSVRALLGTVGTRACLTLIAGYAPRTAELDWCLYYPEDSDVLQLVSHDSSKRRRPAWLVLVAQARPGWSKARLDQPAETWQAQMLEELARRIGRWAGRPAWTDTHRWRYARVDQGSTLSRPIVLNASGGARLGLAGELFAPVGGVEGAWHSGRALGRRLAGDG